MPTEKTVTRETKIDVDRPSTVRETKTTTKTQTRQEPERKVREETTVVEEEDD